MATFKEAISALKVGGFHRIADIIPAGSLEARRLSRGVSFYWRYTLGGKTAREHIGVYDPDASPKAIKPSATGGFSVEAARRAAQEMAGQHHAARESGGHAALKLAKKKVEEEAASAAKRAAEFTLSALLDEYCDHNEKIGRLDVGDARCVFRLHVKMPFPEIAGKPAAACTKDDFVRMLRRLQEAGKKRTSNKLRSYARSAYEVAIAAESQSAIPARFISYGIAHNPVSDTRPDPSGNKADKKPLTLSQMRQYWRLIENLPGLRGAMLRVHLLSGAQRIKQLVRATNAEVNDGILMLWDGKGKPGRGPRPHPIPLTSALAKAVAECKSAGEYLMSTDGGETPLANTTLSNWARDAVGDAIPEFEAKHLRSGVETLLAKAKVHKEERGRLQSHGVGGVQDTNYNAYDYIEEKMDALETLYHWLTATPEIELEKRRLVALDARLGRQSQRPGNVALGSDG